MNNNTGRNIGIITSVVFITQLIFRSMGDGNKAFRFEIEVYKILSNIIFIIRAIINQ